MGRSRVNTSFPEASPSEHEVDTDVDVEQEGIAQAESATPSQPPPSKSTSFHLATQISTLTTKSELAHLREFMVEQLHLMQVTILSKLDSIETRVQAC